MKLNEGPISENQLIENLVKAKQVMAKVSDGDYEKGNINEAALVDDSESYNVGDQLLQTETEAPLDQSTMSNLPPVNEERINNSNLPESIKEAMRKHPIQQIKLDDSLNMDFVERTKKIMEQEGVSTKTKTSQRRSTQPQNVSSINENTLTTIITPIIENIIRKTLDDIVDTKLNQILTAHKTATINENLVLKVGNSIFQGKITNVSKTK